MKLRELGEFGFIDTIKKGCINLSEDIIKGIDDDAAVYKVEDGLVHLVTTDLLLENVHFLHDKISPEQLGYKSLAVNLSDIAAMGGIAQHAFVSIAIPDRFEVEYLERLYDGMKKLAKKFNVNILGGDTTSSRNDLAINVAVTGIAKEDEILYRNGAKVGDEIFVTSFLGDSGAGLEIILNDLEVEEEIKCELVKAHNEPYPYLEEGRFIARTKLANSMIDVSDGVNSDLGHICKQSEVGAEIYEQQLPMSHNLRKFVEKFNLDRAKLMLSTGEDYVLLLTAAQGGSRILEEKYFDRFGKKLIKIGKIVDGERIELQKTDGGKIMLEPKGYEHFLT